MRAAVFLVEPPTNASTLVDVVQKTLLCFRHLVDEDRRCLGLLAILSICFKDRRWTSKKTFLGFLAILPICFNDKTVAGNAMVCKELLDICTLTDVSKRWWYQASEEHALIVTIEVECVVLVLKHGTATTIAMVQQFLKNVLNGITWSELVRKREHQEQEA